MKSFVYGLLAMFPIALVALGAAFAGLAQEGDNRAATQLRKQWTIDKAHILKMPEIHKKTRTQDCQLSDSEIRCLYSDKSGVQKIAVAK